MSSHVNVSSLLPWDDLPEDKRRLRVFMALALILWLLFTIAIPFIKVPKTERRTTDVVPERLARVMMEKKKEREQLPPPPKPELKEEKKPEEKKEEKPKDEPKPEVKPEPKPAAVKIDVQKEAARQKAQAMLQESGLNDLQGMLDEPVGAAGPGTLAKGGAEAAGTSRNLLTSKAGAGSGGLASAGYGGPVSSGFGGGTPGGKGSAGTRQMAAGLKGSDVKSSIGEGGPVGRQAGANGKLKRTEEEVRRIFDRYAGRLNSAYQRELRDDPTLQGSVTVKLTIAPDGSVTDCKIASSQLNNPSLESKIVAMVRGFRFEPIDGDVWTGPYTLNFLPGG